MDGQLKESNKNEHVVDIVCCSSWGEFRRRVMDDYAITWFPHGGPDLVSYPLFRGHANPDWQLSSSWERRISSIEMRLRGRHRWAGELERILEDFKDMAYGAPGVYGHDLSELDWWAIGRHYGLLTPLPDWTRSPYVALFLRSWDTQNPYHLVWPLLEILIPENFSSPITQVK